MSMVVVVAKAIEIYDIGSEIANATVAAGVVMVMIVVAPNGMFRSLVAIPSTARQPLSHRWDLGSEQ